MRTTWLAYAVTLVLALRSASGAQEVTLDGARLGRTFEGIGACSAGASSRLLIEYPPRERRAVLDYLFRPRFGAGFQHLKVEVGGDVNSTDGIEPSHQHTRDDLNFHRGYEWWLMREARRRNPRVFLDALAWGAPGWIGDGRFFSQDMADYLVRFLEGARTAHGLDLDYVGLWNETPYEPDWIKLLRRTLDQAGLERVKIVAADQVNHWGIVDQMAQDPALREAVAVVGVHYPGAQSPPAARECGKPIWSSEDGPWRGDWAGARVLARTYNRNYVEGRMTKTIIWSPVTSYYDNLPLPGSGVLRANEPWSGHFEVQPAVWATAHTTQFASPGWTYLEGQGCGRLAGGGSYVTLRAPRRGDYSIVVETIDATTPQTVTFRLAGPLSRAPLAVWRTSEHDHFRRVRQLDPADSLVTVVFDPGCIYSLTTTRGQRKGMARSPAPRPLPTPYHEGFERYPTGATPRLFSDQAGVFEVHPRPDGAGHCLRQVIARKGIEWHYHKDPFPETVVGDRHWRDYALEVHARIEAGGFAAVFGRVAQVPQSPEPPDGYGFKLGSDGVWELFASTNRLAQGRFNLRPTEWRRLELRFRGNQVDAAVDGETVVSLADETFACGMAGLGCGWHPTDFDDFQVNPVSGFGVVTRTPPVVAPGNLAAHGSTSASSRWDFSYPAEAATDGDRSTRWCAARDKAGGEWLEVNLGRRMTFGRAVLRPFDRRITGHQIEYWDGQGWRTTGVGGPVGFPVHDERFPEVTAERVRFLATGSPGPVSLWEFEVYARPE